MSTIPLNIEAFCTECNSATPVIVSDNIVTVELACDICEADIRYTFPRFGQDFCPWCGIRVLDFEWGGYEAEDGQRGHTKCRNVAVQRDNARLNRENAARLVVEGKYAEAERWVRLAVEADAAADRMEAEK